MRINKKVIDVYDNEFNVLIEKLKDMNKFERSELYVSHVNVPNSATDFFSPDSVRAERL